MQRCQIEQHLFYFFYQITYSGFKYKLFMLIFIQSYECPTISDGMHSNAIEGSPIPEFEHLSF